MPAPIFPNPPDEHRVVFRGVEYPQGRYGRRRSPATAPRWLIGLLVAGVMLGGLGVSWRLYHTYAADKITSQVLSFAVVSDSTVKIEFRVIKKAGESAECFLRARSEQGDEVGRAIVHIPATDRRSVVVTHELKTSQKAVTGEVRNCAPSSN